MTFWDQVRIGEYVRDRDIKDVTTFLVELLSDMRSGGEHSRALYDLYFAEAPVRSVVSLCCSKNRKGKDDLDEYIQSCRRLMWFK